MGKSSPSQPAPVVVNPTQSAGQQAQFNEESARKQRALNMVDQYTPEGSIKYSATGEDIEGIPQYKVTQELSPTQQSLYDTSNRLSQQYGDIGEAQLGQVASTLSNPFSTESLGAAPVYNEQYRADTLAKMMQRQQPQADRDRAALQTELANKGFTEGTEGYNTAMDERNRAMNDLYLGADIGAGSEAATAFGLESSSRDRLINEMLMNRNQPMNELSQLMSGSQSQAPTFIPTPQGSISAPDIMGAQYASANQQNTANQNAYNQQVAQQNAGMQGLYGLGEAGIGAAGFKFSDRRLKENIKKIGKLANGLAVYSYNYIWDKIPQIGLMADEVKNLHPHAVINVDGFYAVNYSEAVK